ncbi:MAG: hypothetical protein HZC48_06255 [Nitrospirae bacterium]|nr:hypothetical protein [Nitrospirota bacterium]
MDLIYEKRWTSDSEDERQKFKHAYRLGLNGFIIDKRLISFDLGGSFSQEINSPGETIDSHSFSANIKLLSEKPRKGFLRHFPQPINLRYSNFATLDSSAHSYGVSLIYGPTENPLFSRKIAQIERERRLKKIMKQAAQRKQESEEESEEEEETEENGNKNGNNGNKGEPPAVEKEKPFDINRFPTFLLDYDKYTYESHNNNTNTDRFDLRAQSTGRNLGLRAEYSYYNYDTGAQSANNFQDIALSSEFHAYDDKAATRLDILNSALLSDNDDLRSMDFRNRINWQQKLGKERRDLITLRGNGNYFISDDDENYEVGGSGSYWKFFSTKLKDDISIDISQGHTDKGAIYNIAAANSLTYVLSKRFTTTNSLSVGQTELGSNIAAGLGLLANIRPVPVSMSAHYYFSSFALDEGRTDYHRLQLIISGRLAKRVNFSSRNSYHISDVGGSEPFRERGYDLRADLYWNISKFSINAGASDTSTERTGDSGADIPDTGALRTTSLYSNISVYLSRRMFLTLSSSYTTDSTGKSITDINPVLSWHARQVTLTAEYEMINTSDPSPGTDHRVIVRLTRTFERQLRPFW